MFPFSSDIEIKIKMYVQFWTKGVSLKGKGSRDFKKKHKTKKEVKKNKIVKLLNIKVLGFEHNFILILDKNVNYQFQYFAWTFYAHKNNSACPCLFFPTGDHKAAIKIINK